MPMARPRTRPLMRRYNSNWLKNETATLPPVASVPRRPRSTVDKCWLRAAHGIPSTTGISPANSSADNSATPAMSPGQMQRRGRFAIGR
jgi:hypothetical protein